MKPKREIESYQTNAQVTTHFIFQGNEGLWLQQSHITRNRRINTRDLDCGFFSQLSLFSEAEIELDQRGTAPIPICLFQKRVGFWNKTQAWERGDMVITTRPPGPTRLQVLFSFSPQISHRCLLSCWAPPSRLYTTCGFRTGRPG